LISGAGDLTIVSPGGSGGTGGMPDASSDVMIERDAADAAEGEAQPDVSVSERDAAPDGDAHASDVDADTSDGGPRALDGEAGSGPPRVLTVLPISKDLFSTDVFAVLDDGLVYVSHRSSTGAPFTGFAPINKASGVPAPPYAPLAGVSRDPTHIDVFFVDNAGQLRNVSLQASSSTYTDALVRSEAGVGGVDTAPPGTPVSAIALSDRRIDAFVIDTLGSLLQFEWMQATGWKPAVRLTAAGTFPSGGAVTVTSHDPPQTMAVYAIDSEGFAWVTSCDSGCLDNRWNPRRFADAPKFVPGTPLSALIRSKGYEELYGVDREGSVWRAWWSESTPQWLHPGYTPFGRFSSPHMLKPGATIATNARTLDGTNLLAADATGAILSEWWDGVWQPHGVAWDATLGWTWSTFFGATNVVPNSVVAMLGNVGVPNALDIFWIASGAPSPLPQIWTIRTAPDPEVVWRWTAPWRIDNVLR
jgi:hypothetical protein